MSSGGTKYWGFCLDGVGVAGLDVECVTRRVARRA